ncbi:MAG: hypothetical protein WAK82_33220 [Streptosporangiaceae bacterium]
MASASQDDTIFLNAIGPMPQPVVDGLGAMLDRVPPVSHAADRMMPSVVVQPPGVLAALRVECLDVE